MRHILKCWPKYYCRIADGSKTFEIRNNDRGFQSGDIVELREWDPSPVNNISLTPKGYVLDSDALEFTIGYIEIIQKDLVAFSLLPIRKTAKLTKLK